jgi:uroporphyrinogen-III synthase
MPAMHRAASRRIVIFRGQGGRELLGNSLRERGASVSYAEVYRRAKPALAPDELLQRWVQGRIQAVIVSSADSLLNLFDIVGEAGQQYLRNTPLIAVSARIIQLAQRLGFSQALLIAREASDEALVEALLELAPGPIRVTSGDPNDG